MQEASYFQLLNPMVMGIFALGFFMVWRHERRSNAALFFAMAYTCGMIGFTLDFAIRDQVGPYWGQYVSNVWLLAITLFVSAGFAIRAGRKPHWQAMAFVYVATFGVVSYYLFVAPSPDMRIMATNGGSGALLAFSLVYLRKQEGDDTARTVDRIIWWIVALSAVQMFARPLVVILVSDVSAVADEYSSSLYALTLHLTSAICAITMAATVLFTMAMDLVRDLNRQSVTDHLTGVLNRRGFYDRVEDEMEKARENGTRLTLIACDIDHFKSVNDRFGHSAGDFVIEGMARILRIQAPQGAIVGRTGGEEFLVLIQGNAHDGISYAEDVRRTFCKTVFRGLPDDQFCTASFGVKEWRADMSQRMVMEGADAALYAAKQNGRNRVHHDGEVATLRTSLAAVA